MPTEFLREIPGPEGPLEALLDVPAAEPRAAAVFAHPHPLYGGTMHTKAVYQAPKRWRGSVSRCCDSISAASAAARARFDAGPGEMEDFRAGLDFMEDAVSGLPLWAAGFSFGSWVALTVGAEDPRVPLLLGIALPVDRTILRP